MLGCELSQSWQCRLVTTASQVFLIVPRTSLCINMTYIVRKKEGRGQRSCLLTVLDLFGGICSAICPGPSLYSGAGLGAINCTNGPSHSWLMDGKASGLWVAHHCQADSLMPGLVDHFITSQEFWNWETKWAGPPMRGARAAAEACEEAERGACQ